MGRHPGGNGKVDGFISNTANYNPFVEPYMNANQKIGGQPVRSLQGWYDWNDYIDEQTYAIALRKALTEGTMPIRPAWASCSTHRATAGAARTADRSEHIHGLADLRA